MINGKAEVKFGTGDIRTNSMLIDDVGVYVLENSEPHEIGSPWKVPDDFSLSKETPVIITFTNPDSIDVVVKDLLYLKDMMNKVVSEDELIKLDTSMSDFWEKE